MKYYVYQHLYKDNTRDAMIVSEEELSKIGFSQEEVEKRSRNFIIEYNKFTLGVAAFRTKEKAQELIDYLKSMFNAKIYSSFKEYNEQF